MLTRLQLHAALAELLECRVHDRRPDRGEPHNPRLRGRISPSVYSTVAEVDHFTAIMADVARKELLRA